MIPSLSSPDTPLRGAVHHIRLTKTGDKGTYPDHPIFEGYTVWGHCQELPEVGKVFQVVRYRRNDVEMLGVMTTSIVEVVGEKIEVSEYCGCLAFLTFETANSLYRLDFLPEDVEATLP
jgi:hypothetical protein